jgi:hypothetical protein
MPEQRIMSFPDVTWPHGPRNVVESSPSPLSSSLIPRYITQAQAQAQACRGCSCHEFRYVTHTHLFVNNMFWCAFSDQFSDLDEHSPELAAATADSMWGHRCPQTGREIKNVALLSIVRCEDGVSLAVHR